MHQFEMIQKIKDLIRRVEAIETALKAPPPAPVLKNALRELPPAAPAATSEEKK